MSYSIKPGTWLAFHSTSEAKRRDGLDSLRGLTSNATLEAQGSADIVGTTDRAPVGPGTNEAVGVPKKLTGFGLGFNCGGKKPQKQG